jgi:hypothetical protein
MEKSRRDDWKKFETCPGFGKRIGNSEARNIFELNIRGEVFNLLNHVNYGAPDSNRADGSFGSITWFFPPRQLQVAARLIF